VKLFVLGPLGSVKTIDGNMQYVAQGVLRAIRTELGSNSAYSAGEHRRSKLPAIAIICLDVLFWFPGVVMIVVAFPMYQYLVVNEVLYKYSHCIRCPKSLAFV
jgi:hypothetical protein